MKIHPLSSFLILICGATVDQVNDFLELLQDEHSISINSSINHDLHYIQHHLCLSTDAITK